MFLTKYLAVKKLLTQKQTGAILYRHLHKPERYFMIEHMILKEKTRNYWETVAADYPHSLNNFSGEFAFGDHDYVPELIRDLVLSQRNEDRFDRIPLSAVNDIANKFWEGPGSCARISDIIWDCRIARAYGANFTESKNAYTLNYTEEEWKEWADGKGD